MATCLGDSRASLTCPLWRHDNGLAFGSKLFQGLCREDGGGRRFITPHDQEEDGVVERFMRSAEEGCLWRVRFESMAEAQVEISHTIEWYDTDRRRQALGYKTPEEVKTGTIN